MRRIFKLITAEYSTFICLVQKSNQMTNTKKSEQRYNAPMLIKYYDYIINLVLPHTTKKM